VSHSHLMRVFKDIMNNASDEELSELMEPAKEGIDCEKCSSETNVIYIDLGRWALFFCQNCIDKIKSEELPAPRSSKGLTLRFKVLIRDNFKCVYCGRSPKEDGVKLEVDHLFPKSKGGSDSMDNLVAACWECNQGKKDLIINELP
jgi:ssDNA-binding Zn-finger/Zn-ribbon topoisomerase 1